MQGLDDYLPNTQTPDDAMICCSIHQRLRTLLAQLQMCLHGRFYAKTECIPLYVPESNFTHKVTNSGKIA
jgi:hypothetical protein